MKKQLLQLAALFIGTTSLAGVYRHDVSPEKYKALAAQKQFDCVGMVMDKFGQNHLGSCVLIGNKYVLSAAHVFMVRDIRVDTLIVDKNGKVTKKFSKDCAVVWVNTPINERPGKIADYSFRFNHRRYLGKQLKINNTYLDSLNNHNIFCGDLVLIELEDTVADITPAHVNTAFNELHTIITGVGYGASGPADKPEDVGPFMEKIAGQNMADNMDGYELDGRSSLLAFDFDAPKRNDCNRTGTAAPLPLEWAAGGGDSGGGLFREINGSWQLVGIITGGPNSGLNMAQYMKTKGYYGGISEHLRVAVFNKWIQQTINEFEKSEMKLDMTIQMK